MTNPSRPKDPSGFRHLDAGLGPALPMDPLAFDRIVEQAVETILDGSRTVERPRRPWQWLALAAIVVASTAGAATLTARHFIVARAPALASSNVLVPLGVNSKILHPPKHRSNDVDELPATATTSMPTSPSPSVPLPSPPKPAAAEDRLAQANQLRQAGRWQEAEAAYLQIATHYAAAPEAEVASLAAAALRLEHLSDPQGALRLYESLAQGGRLSVEARFGVARCQRALGNPAAEAAALAMVVELAPQSLQADRARQRLSQLRQENATSLNPKD